ncbi:WG repeat-containing protein [Clostridium massiliodielmoense]|uniref:WG repeat-containing protein n=1 Tax=Clostridium massiliodielmoense TaxID=1776385 RepID=UPI000A270A8F|nr:WG repeat-containing protein [Clostridium massiliodielmoense]
MTSNTLNDPNCRPYKDKGGKYEFLNKEGKNIAPYEFDDFQYTTSSKDLISVYKNHKWGFINKKGTVIKDFQFEDVNGFCEDLISVKQNRKWGCMDRSGNITIPFKFDKSIVFTNGIAIVDIDSKEGAIDKRGNFLVLPKFDCIKPEFNCGLAMVELGNLTGVIDIKGNYIVKPNNIYNVYQWDSKSIFMMKNIGSADILDIESKKIKHLNYKQICGFKNDIIFISENNKWDL